MNLSKATEPGEATPMTPVSDQGSEMRNAGGEGAERTAQNAQAPGPVTEAGKAIASRNALKHGLSAQKAENAVAAEMKEQYEALRADYMREYKPSGATENTLMDMIVLSAWQLYKVREMELFSALDFGIGGSRGQSEKLARYRASHERALYKGLNQLRQVQQERLLRETDEKAELPGELPPGVRLQALKRHLVFLEKHPKTRSVGTGSAEVTGVGVHKASKAPPNGRAR